MVKRSLTGDAEIAFSNWARIMIQVQMQRRDLTYAGLTQLFNKRFDTEESERNMRVKISRGSFTAAFLLMCLYAMDCTSISITDDDLRLTLTTGPNAVKQGASWKKEIESAVRGDKVRSR